jgi:hypothetical protein
MAAPTANARRAGPSNQGLVELLPMIDPSPVGGNTAGITVGEGTGVCVAASDVGVGEAVAVPIGVEVGVGVVVAVGVGVAVGVAVVGVTVGVGVRWRPVASVMIGVDVGRWPAASALPWP